MQEMQKELKKVFVDKVSLHLSGIDIKVRYQDKVLYYIIMFTKQCLHLRVSYLAHLTSYDSDVFASS